MRVYYLILLIPTILYSQEKTYSCDEIKKVIDFNIYDTLSNGKLVARFDKAVNQRLYKIIIEGNNTKYVTKPVMRRIKKSVRKNKCPNVIIDKVKNVDEVDFKIIRD